MVELALIPPSEAKATSAERKAHFSNGGKDSNALRSLAFYERPLGGTITFTIVLVSSTQLKSNGLRSTIYQDACGLRPMPLPGQVRSSSWTRCCPP
jgi:hypothetical protein